MPEPSPLERAFETLWLQCTNGLTPPEREFQFHPTRKWSFDFAFPDCGVAIELEGGAGTGGRHTTFTGFANDCEKYNAAAERGWLVLRYTGAMLKRDPIQMFEQIVRTCNARKELLNGCTSLPNFIPVRVPKERRVGSRARRPRRP